MFGLIEQCQRSGKSQKDFCKAQSINYFHFKYWRRVFLQEQVKDSKEKKPGFVPIALPASFTNLKAIEISYPNGVRISCPKGMSKEHIKELVQLF